MRLFKGEFQSNITNLKKKIGRQEWILKSIEIETLEKTEMHLDSDEVSYAKAASK